MLADLHWLTGVYVFAIILMVFTHARAFHFNPMMGLLGFHFCSLKNSDGSSMLLISRREFHRTGSTVQAVRLAHDIYLQIGGTDA